MSFLLDWDEVGKKVYETGVDRGVLYVYDNVSHEYGDGVNWNGITSVNESPSGAEVTDLWADNIKYLSIRSLENFNFTINAYTSPDQFDECDGMRIPLRGVRVTQQNRKMFGFSYRSLIGNDTEYNDYGYEIHLVYGATCSPSDKDRQTVNDSPDAVEFSWECTTTPVPIGFGLKPTAHLIIKSTDFITDNDKERLKNLESILYGKKGDYNEYEQIIFDETPIEYKPYKYYIKMSVGSYAYYQLLTAETPPSTWGNTGLYYRRTDIPARLPLPDEVLGLLGGVGMIFTTMDGLGFHTKDQNPYAVLG